jgi:hypothetical protein
LKTFVPTVSNEYQLPSNTQATWAVGKLPVVVGWLLLPVVHVQVLVHAGVIDVVLVCVGSVVSGPVGVWLHVGMVVIIVVSESVKVCDRMMVSAND